MVQVSYPGVYVQEVASGVRTITGVSTSIAAFVGLIQRGQLNTPTTVLSFADYQRAFGNDTTESEMTDQVRQFFLNGGQQAVIVRIPAPVTTSASVQLKSEFGNNSLNLTAKDPGGVGNQLRAVVSYDTPNPESTFNLRVFREVVTNGVLQIDADETIQGLSMDPSAPNFVETVVNQTSTLVNAQANAVAATTVAFSRSALIIGSGASADDAATAINGLIAGSNNKITIAVDGKPAVIAPLSNLVTPDSSSLDTRLGVWTTDINTALNGAATVAVHAVTLASGNLQIEIESSTGGSVVVSPAPNGDAAEPLQLGVAQGGIEVSGHAAERPAPSGYFSTLANNASDVVLVQLNALANADGSAFGNFNLTDASGDPAHNAPVPLPTGSLFGPAISTVFVGSLRNVRTNLQSLANTIAQNSNGDWTAALQGYRLVLTPTFGTVNADATAVLTTTGAFNIGGSAFSKAPNVRAYSLGASSNALGTYQILSTPGADGTTSPGPDEYNAAFDAIDREVDLVNLVVLPKSTRPGLDDTRSEVWGDASAFCLARRAFLIADAPSTGTSAWNSVATVVAQIENFRIGLVKDHTGLYWPPVLVPGPNNTTRPIDPSGSVAGIMARIDSSRGVFKAPAGIEADVRGIAGVKIRMSDPENGLINPKAVNAIRVFPNGIVTWGARTLDGFDNSGNTDYKYVPVRRLALFIEESLIRGLKFAVFEPNDEPLWAQIRLAAGSFMNGLFRQGAFQGQKQSDAYFVKVDSETTTQNDINLGIVNVVVGFAPLKPAEFVVITIQQKAGQVQV